MRIKDLGDIEGKILLFGGVYSNLAALDAVIAIANDRGIAPTHMMCLGDVVAYCADAQASVERIRELGCPVLSGNCEVQLAQGSDDCGCGFDEGSECSLLSRGWYTHAQRQVTPDSTSWMGQLPERIVFTHAGKRYVLVHGGASDISKFIWPVSSDAEIAAEIALAQQQVGPVDGVIGGHTGLYFTRVVDGVEWINVGAIGMPPNDGDTRGGFAIMDTGEVTFERFEYDFDATAQAMKDAGLVQGYHEAVKTGYWPSEDTLPPVMRGQSSAKG